jgi:putative transposase
MGTSSLKAGAIIEIDGRTHTLLAKIDKETWQLSDLRTRRIKELTDAELRKAYSSGLLRFETATQIQLANDQRKTREDFSDAQWEKAKIRRTYVMAVLDMPSDSRKIQPIVTEAWQKLQQPKRAPGASSVLRWKKAFLNAGRDITSLIDRNDKKGNTVSRYPKEVCEIVREAVETKYLTRERGTLQNALDKALYEVNKENGLRPKPIWLPRPTRRLVERVIAETPAFERCEARFGRQAATKRFRWVKGHLVSTAPLEKVEIDHTQLDILVIDEATSLPLGRPWLTLCVDRFTRCVLGVHLSFEPPSYLTVSKCLRQAITPKEWIKEQFPAIKNPWAAHGVMTVLVVDNGMEFHSKSLENACYTLGIELQYSPRRTPWFKPYVERLIGTLNRGVAHGTPGTSFSNILERDDYDPAKTAVIRYSTLREILYTWVVDVYHQRAHRTLGASPASMWENSISPDEIRLADDPVRLDAILGASEVRTLTHKGIELYGLFYNSPQLADLRRNCSENVEVDIRVDPTDLGKIVVVPPGKDEMYSVPALRMDYANGLSLWQHKVCKRFAAQQLERVSTDSWLEAKERISELVNSDFARKKVKTRAKMARYKGDAALMRTVNSETSDEVGGHARHPAESVNTTLSGAAGLPRPPEAMAGNAKNPAEYEQSGITNPLVRKRFTPQYRERALFTEDDNNNNEE